MKAKKPKKRQKSMAALVEDTAKLLQRLVRLKASDSNGFCQCVTCGKVDHYKNMQGGHFIERRKTSVKLIEENVNPQCEYCNQWGMKQASTVLIYNDWMIQMHGTDFVDDLKRQSRQVRKYSRGEVEDMAADFKARIQEQELRLTQQDAA
jgi:hypothetical protein